MESGRRPLLALAIAFCGNIYLTLLLPVSGYAYQDEVRAESDSLCEVGSVLGESAVLGGKSRRRGMAELAEPPLGAEEDPEMDEDRHFHSTE
eukprot:7381418-Prymnesium_polylepis.1